MKERFDFDEILAYRATFINHSKTCLNLGG